jgi:[acyl-carrier-protein] S-malonyltransferase
MGKALAEAFPVAREVFQEVDEALSQKLSMVMFEGPMEELTLTANTQPALMANSVAVMRVLQAEGGLDLGASAKFIAGHSLGEYSALAAAGALDLADTARLLKLRGQAMQAAVPAGEGAMAALLGLDLEAAREAAAEGAGDDVCDVANDNAPGQVVVSGATAAVERAIEAAKARGARRAILLPVSAPFHCSLLQPAADAMEEAFETTAMSAPAVPLMSNVTASPVADPDEIKRLLVQQVTATVRWREGVLAMAAAGVDELIEIGCGKVLSGMVKRITKEMTAKNAETPEDIEALLKAL